MGLRDRIADRLGNETIGSFEDEFYGDNSDSGSSSNFNLQSRLEEMQEMMEDDNVELSVSNSLPVLSGYDDIANTLKINFNKDLEGILDLEYIEDITFTSEFDGVSDTEVDDFIIEVYYSHKKMFDLVTEYKNDIHRLLGEVKLLTEKMKEIQYQDQMEALESSKYETKIERLENENQNLREISSTLENEKDNLLNENESLLEEIKSLKKGQKNTPNQKERPVQRDILDDILDF